MAQLTASPSPPGVQAPGRSRARARVRTAAAVAVVVATVAVVGAGPFLRGIASVSVGAIAVALLLFACATAACAWRWVAIATGLGLPLSWRSAFAAYYRSQFLNTVLPGGVLGDVHRAYLHGRENDRMGPAARAVAAERIAGQVVQLAVTLAILLPLGFASALAPLQWSAGVIAAAAAAGILVVVAIPASRRWMLSELRILRPVLTRASTLIVVVAASVLALAAHVSLFLVAGAAVGVSAGSGELVPIALVVLTASAIPINVGGWGPREAASGAVFALAGIGGAAGVAVSTAFGVLALIAVAPGALVLLIDRIRARRETRPA
jgi:glycosyltransferase 2 family protein